MKKVLFLLICLLSAVATWAQTFTYTYQGSELEYTIVDEAAQTCEVSGYKNCAEDLIIPTTVPYLGRQYSVVGIENYALSNCNIISVSISTSVTTIGHHAFSDCSRLHSVAIPASVTEIGNQAFWQCRGLAIIDVNDNNANYSSADGVLFNKDKTILYNYPMGKTDYEYSIPHSVTTIGFQAFAGCGSLVLLTMPSSVTEIGTQAFASCTGLLSISISNSLATIEEGAFLGCSGLKSVTIPNSVITIGTNAFAGCSGLTSVFIPNSVATIGEAAFAQCSSLTSVTIPASVTTIESVAFSGCTALNAIDVDGDNVNYSSADGVLFSKDKTILYTYPQGKTASNYEIPRSVAAIGRGAFSNCSRLTSVTIPASVTTIGSRAFSSCSGLTTVVLPASVTTIESQAFSGCSSLTAVVLPNSVATIGEEVFSGCSSLTSVTIPASVTAIGSQVFNLCTALTAIYVEGDNANYSSVDGVLFNKDKTILYTYPLGKTALKYEIPRSVTAIGSQAFYGCTSLISVSIPDSVTAIGSQAFLNCSRLTSVAIPDKLTTIEDDTFYGCSSLISAAIPASVTTIGMRAFSFCYSLESVTIPGSVTAIGDLAFYGCRALEQVYYGADDPVAANENVFSDYSKPTLYVKAGAVDKIRATVPWSMFDKVETYDFPDDKPYIFSYEYETATNTASVIGIMANSIVDVIIPSIADINGDKFTITGISARAFAGNGLLRSVTIPSTVRDIEPGSFRGCANLETVNYYPETVNTTDSHHSSPVFSNCPKFKNLNIGETVKVMPKYMFRTIDIETLDIPDNVETLQSDCFADCYRLAEIRLGRGIRSIECASFALGVSSALSTKVYCNAWEITYYRGFGGGTSSYMPFSNRTVASIEFGPDVALLADYAFTDVSGVSDIYCNGTTPPVVANDNVLKSVDKSACMLHVPAGSLRLYRNAYFWRDFYNFKGDLSGIDDVVVDDHTPIEVYNLNGLKVADSLDGLAPGLYIVRRGNKAEKVLVRP